jgi:rod shape determining protein RodA
MQPDTGTVLVFCGFLFMLYREGLSGNMMLFGVYAFALALVTLMLKDSTVDLPIIGNETAAKYVIIIVITSVLGLTALLVTRLVNKRNRKMVLALILAAYVGSAGMVMAVDYAFKNVLGNHQKTRIDIFLGLKDDPNGEGYNIDRSMASIGSGGVTGKGYMGATLATKQQKHVPMQSTDFIYCTLSEEWGFLGSFAVVCAFVFLLIRIITLAERQRLAFTRIYGYSIAAIFFMHFLVNVGMTMGIVPVIGIPLPFFSYGGSSLMSFTILLAVMIRLDAERMDVLR